MAHVEQSILKPATRSDLFLKLVSAVLTLISALPAFSQASSTDGAWSGSIQCQLDVEQPGYSRHERQTWTLTGSELAPNGVMRIYAANWTYTGQGALQLAQGSRTTIAQWVINVPETNAPLAMFVRASDRRFIIRLWHSQAMLHNAVTGTRQITVNGMPQQPGPINYAVSEWPLPWIDAIPSTNISGSLSVQTEGPGADLAQVGPPPTAVCKYQFSKAGALQSPSNMAQNPPGASPQTPNPSQVSAPSVSPMPGASAPVTAMPGATLPIASGSGKSSIGAPAPLPSSPPAPAPVPAHTDASAPNPSAPAPSSTSPAPADTSSSRMADDEGMPSSATIGPSGGTLKSSDGRLTISIPAGALSTPTEVAIQPITAKAPGALGSDYRLTPEGQIFAKPVNLICTYSAEEAAANAPDLLRVATREASGSWNAATTSRDATRHALTVATTHFSDWSYVGGLQIAPASAVVEVNKTVPLTVIFCGDASAANAANTAAVLVECQATSFRLQFRRWSVNGVTGGNATTGTVRGGESVGGASNVAVYKAPGAVPTQNPVSVSAEVDTGRGKEVLVSTIKVIDKVPKYEGTFSGMVQIPYGGFHQISANLRLTYEPRDADRAFGDRTFVGSGMASVTARPIGCNPATAGINVHGELTLHGVDGHDHGSLTGTYSIAVGDMATMTFECGEPSAPATVTYPAYVGSCPSRLDDLGVLGYDLGLIKGSGSCTPADGSKISAHWTLRAVE